MQKVLVTDYVHPLLLQGLEKLGYTTEYDKDFDPNGLDSILQNYQGIIINSKIKLDKRRLSLAKNLKFIGRLGSGLEIIDLDAARELGIHVFNSPEGNRNAVAEHAIGMLLSLTNNILRGDKEVRSRIWKREANRGVELEGKTVGIIGMGNTGQAFARKLSCWALDLIYNDPYVLELPKDLANIEGKPIDQLRERSDIISLHVPLTSETRRMIDKEFLSSCKKGTIIINTSRGPVVHTKDLIDALKSGQISGACLDVFENEKPQNFTPEEDQLFDELYALPNVVLTPHVAGWTDASLRKIAEVLIDKISKINSTGSST